MSEGPLRSQELDRGQGLAAGDHGAPRRCLREPIQEIFNAAKLLSAAVVAHLMGRTRLAEELIVASDDPALTAWTESLWGATTAEIHRVRAVEGAPPKQRSLDGRMPTQDVRRRVLLRDGRHCRFCGIPVIQPHIRKAISEAYPNALRWGDSNTEQHAAFQCMWQQFDHVFPHSRGGDSSYENVIVTCAPCNFGRNEWMLEEVGLLDPRVRLPIRSDWDGLERFVAKPPRERASIEAGK